MYVACCLVPSLDHADLESDMEETVDKYDLRPHMRFEIECLGAKWHTDKGQWEVNLKDTRTKIEYSRYATILISAVGGISTPRDVKFPGMEKFKGEMFHTARWNHKYDYSGKRMAVIGNGWYAHSFLASKCPKLTVSQFRCAGRSQRLPESLIRQAVRSVSAMVP